MKDAKNTLCNKEILLQGKHYLQIDNKIENVFAAGGVEILSSFKAWEKLSWTREYFSKKPKKGYFIWVKKQINFPLLTCVSIASKSVKQNLQNLLVVEKNLNVEVQGACSALKKDLGGNHKAGGKIVLKQGSSLKYRHVHSWGKKDIVETDYNFTLEKNSKLDYSYESFSTPKKLKIKTKIDVFQEAGANMKITIDCDQTDTEIKDFLALKEKGASGQIQLRLVGRKGSEILSYSRILAAAEGKGHLDCQGLLVGENSRVSLIPQLVCQNKNAQITHEASIGKISEDELNYLRMRGLSEKQAIDLIINGFLGI